MTTVLADRNILAQRRLVNAKGFTMMAVTVVLSVWICTSVNLFTIVLFEAIDGVANRHNTRLRVLSRGDACNMTVFCSFVSNADPVYTRMR